MRRIILILAAAGLALTTALMTKSEPILYYIQLVRGTDSTEPPELGSRKVGPKLEETFRGVLRWNHYWEIAQRKLEVTPGSSAKLRLNDEREVKIDLKVSGKRAVMAFQNGKLVNRTISPMGESMTIIGGDRDKKSSWFIVVRKDKPPP